MLCCSTFVVHRSHSSHFVISWKYENIARHAPCSLTGTLFVLILSGWNANNSLRMICLISVIGGCIVVSELHRCWKKLSIRMSLMTLSTCAGPPNVPTRRICMRNSMRSSFVVHSVLKMVFVTSVIFLTASGRRFCCSNDVSISCSSGTCCSLLGPSFCVVRHLPS